MSKPEKALNPKRVEYLMMDETRNKKKKKKFFILQSVEKYAHNFLPSQVAKTTQRVSLVRSSNVGIKEFLTPIERE